MKEIIVPGVGGLGNILFQLAAAIPYAIEYKYSIVFDNCSLNLHVGTAKITNRNRVRKINGIEQSYKNTIFNTNNISYKNILPNINKVIENNYTSDKYTPQDNDIVLKIQGYCQNILLFYEYLKYIPEYINLKDIIIFNYIYDKYNISKDDDIIMIGMRLCDDFKHMNKITAQSYNKAIKKLNPTPTTKIMIIADNYDIAKSSFKLDTNCELIYIDEDDITQIYAGLLCSSFILSESTFHWWISTLKCAQDETTKVICFNNTDLTNRPLVLPNWIVMDY
jgi:hypothetical protein